MPNTTAKQDILDDLMYNDNQWMHHLKKHHTPESRLTLWNCQDCAEFKTTQTNLQLDLKVAERIA